MKLYRGAMASILVHDPNSEDGVKFIDIGNEYSTKDKRERYIVCWSKEIYEKYKGCLKEAYPYPKYKLGVRK